MAMKRLILFFGLLCLLLVMTTGVWAEGPQPEAVITVNIHVRLRDEAGLRALVEQQQTPGSAVYRRWLTHDEFRRRFAPTTESCDRVEAWAKAAGLKIAYRINDRSLLVCQAPASVIRKVFAPTLAGFQAARAAGQRVAVTQLPADLASDVSVVEGLDGVDLYHSPRAEQPAIKANTNGQNCDLRQLLYPQDLWSLYNLSPLYNVGIKGNGQKVALVMAGAVAPADLTMFQQSYNLPVRAVEPHSVGLGTPGAAFNGAMAEVEYLSALAPEALIQAVQVAASSSGDVTATNITAAIGYVVDRLRDTKVVATSLGICEQALSPATIQAQEVLLLQAAAQGQTWVVASGDNGSDGCRNNGNSVFYPATSPNVTAVGGTELLPIRDSEGKVIRYDAEIAWNNDAGASGGGTSLVFEKPSYQSRMTILPGRKRAIPDVSFHGGGNLVVILNGIRTCYAGTGVPAAAWAAIFTLVNQQIGGSGLGAVNLPLYNLGIQQAAGTGPEVYRDILSGNNFVGNSIGDVTGPGFDPVTGWGTFDGERFVRNFTSGLPRPALELSSSLVNFGTLRIGRKSDPLELTLQSVGAAPLQVREIKLDDEAKASGFALEPCPESAPCTAPFTLESPQSIALRLTWTPKGVGQVKGKLLISNNSVNIPESAIALTGIGSDDSRAPRVILLGFTGAQTLEPDSLVTIKWEASDDRGVVKTNLLLSANGGETFPTVIAAGIPPTTSEFEWKVPTTIFTSQGVIKVQSFDAAQNVGEDQSPGLLTIPDRQPPTGLYLTAFPQFLEIGDKLQIGWQAQDNAGIQSQRLALLVNGTPVPVAPNLDGTIREFLFDTTALEPNLRVQLVLTLVDLNGIESVIPGSTFDIKPKVTNIVLEKKSATLTGVGFKAGSTVVLVNGIPISSSVVTIESSTKITIKGKPKKQRITPGSLIGVLVNNTPSKEIVVR